MAMPQLRQPERRAAYSFADDEIFREPMTYFLFALLLAIVAVIAVFVVTHY